MVKHPKQFFDDRPKLFEFLRVYKDVNVAVGFELPAIDKRHYFVQCNPLLPEEPFKIFKALNFKEKFDSHQSQVSSEHCTCWKNDKASYMGQ